MALYERAKKILAGTCDHRVTAFRCTHCNRRQQRSSTIYLHIILKKHSIMQKDTSTTTMLVISMGFLILFLIFSWQWSVILSLIVGLLGIVSKSLSKRIEKGWMGLAHILSYIIPSILLAMVFYLILFPMALISKLFTKDPLMLSGNYDSYFVDVNKKVEKSQFEKVW